MAAVRKLAMNGSRPKSLPLKSIRLDGDTQSRDELNEDVIKEYAGLMADGVEFPPLLVVHDGAHYWLVDGFHRRFAAVKAKLDKFKCVVVTGTREDARWLSYGANIDHGLPRTNEDKQKAVVAALKHPKGLKLSDHKIAAHVGVVPTTVAKYRRHVGPTIQNGQSDERTGRDGRTINTANIGRKPDPKPDPKPEPPPAPEPDDEPEPEHEAAAVVLPDKPSTVVRHATEPNVKTERSVFTDLRKLFDAMTTAERKQAHVMWDNWLDDAQCPT